MRPTPTPPQVECRGTHPPRSRTRAQGFRGQEFRGTQRCVLVQQKHHRDRFQSRSPQALVVHSRLAADQVQGQGEKRAETGWGRARLAAFRARLAASRARALAPILCSPPLCDGTASSVCLRVQEGRRREWEKAGRGSAMALALASRVPTAPGLQHRPRAALRPPRRVSRRVRVRVHRGIAAALNSILHVHLFLLPDASGGLPRRTFRRGSLPEGQPAGARDAGAQRL